MSVCVLAFLGITFTVVCFTFIIRSKPFKVIVISLYLSRNCSPCYERVLNTASGISNNATKRLPISFSKSVSQTIHETNSCDRDLHISLMWL